MKLKLQSCPNLQMGKPSCDSKLGPQCKMLNICLLTAVLYKDDFGHLVLVSAA